MKKKVDKFFLEDPQVLVRYPNEFFPNSSMSNDEILNAYLRLSFYISLMIFFVHKNINIFLIPLITGVFLVFINRFNSANALTKEVEEILEHNKEQENCQMPSEENPYMNTLISDLRPGVEKKPACTGTKKVREEIKELYYKDLFRDVGDVYQSGHSERQFFTMPNTTKFGVKHGDHNELGKFLYSTGDTCKENTFECTNSFSAIDNDLRRNRNTLTQDELLPLVPYES